MSDMMNGPAPGSESGGATGARTAAGVLGASATEANHGVLAIIDLGRAGVLEQDSPRRLAHFRAHDAQSAVVQLEFNPAGTLLATADIDGQHVHIFSVIGQATHVAGTKALPDAPLLRPRHLYTLRRGVTTSLICGITWSPVSFCTHITRAAFSLVVTAPCPF